MFCTFNRIWFGGTQCQIDQSNLLRMINVGPLPRSSIHQTLNEGAFQRQPIIPSLPYQIGHTVNTPGTEVKSCASVCVCVCLQVCACTRVVCASSPLTSPPVPDNVNQTHLSLNRTPCKHTHKRWQICTQSHTPT